MHYGYAHTPIGTLLVAGEAGSVTVISFRPEPRPEWTRDDALFAGTIDQLGEYFTGRRRTFDLPLVPKGTEFQLAVWNALTKIPYGETRSYSDVARTIRRPDAVRAVGAANGANPLPIVIPCHRVIGANGALTGFGGGIETKKFLLELERGERKLF
ncbi:MAG TPA: methylated-DNA--[protein]-cysteine S-methyltransferase [Thermoanaerobaculia bacterium]|jgi:methylated-DNA-[protein]-cysteine S-methyltransferase